MPVVIYTLWPLFALIVAGYSLRRFQFPNEAFWPGAERLNYFCLFPALLFYNLSKAPLDSPELISLGGAALVGLLLATCLLILWRRVAGWRAERFGVFVQGGLRFNTYLGLAIVGALFQADGLAQAAIMLALMVPVVNVISVWALTAQQGMRVGALLSPIARNPLILACVAGAVVNYLGIPIGGGFELLLGHLSSTSLPLGLLCVGAALQPQALVGEARALILNCGFRLLMMPMLGWLVATLFGLPPQESLIVVLFFALPTAPTAYVLTRQLQGDSHLMAAIITLQTLFAGVSLVVILSLFANTF